MVKRAATSLAIVLPTVIMAACWVALFANPRLGLNEALKPVFITFFLLSCATCVAGIIQFFVRQRSSHSTACLVISIVGIALNIYGFLSPSAQLVQHLPNEGATANSRRTWLCDHIAYSVVIGFGYVTPRRPGR